MSLQFRERSQMISSHIRIRVRAKAGRDMEPKWIYQPLFGRTQWI